MTEVRKVSLLSFLHFLLLFAFDFDYIIATLCVFGAPKIRFVHASLTHLSVLSFSLVFHFSYQSWSVCSVVGFRFHIDTRVIIRCCLLLHLYYCAAVKIYEKERQKERKSSCWGNDFVEGSIE